MKSRPPDAKQIHLGTARLPLRVHYRTAATGEADRDIDRGLQCDGIVVPVAQPIVAALGTTGVTVTGVDLLVHPAVVAACQALKDVPVSATPVATVNPGTVTTAASP
jgi:hypothetical protein